MKVDVFSTEVFRAKIFKATVDRDFQSKDVYVEEALHVLKDLGDISSTQSNLSVIQEK